MAQTSTATEARREAASAASSRQPSVHVHNGGPTILDVMEHPKLLGGFFEPQEHWERWKVALAAAFGLPPPDVRIITDDGEELDALGFYQRHTGRSKWPERQAFEAWFPTGARGGKSRIAALIAVYLGAFRNYLPYLSPGEYGTIPVIAADRRQARVVLGYVRAMLTETLLRQLVVGETQESFTLNNRVRIEIHTASFRSMRGYTCLAGVCDEIAVWQSEGANPDSEIITSLRTRFATIPGAMLVAISSPYARAGELWDTYDKHYGDKGDPDILVWKAATWDMNPTIPRDFIKRQYERDPQKAAAEYGGEFRTDVERFVTIEVVRECTMDGVAYQPPMSGVTYKAFIDPSGGRSDAMVLAIGHLRQDGAAVLDCLRVFKAPFVPTKAISECVGLCRQYRIHRVYGDRFGGEWPREGFKSAGIEYVLHSKAKSDLYVDLLPRLFSGTIALLDIPELTKELVALERRVSASGREIIDHPAGGHDDHANAVAGLVSILGAAPTLSPVWGTRRRH